MLERCCNSMPGTKKSCFYQLWRHNFMSHLSEEKHSWRETPWCFSNQSSRFSAGFCFQYSFIFPPSEEAVPSCNTSWKKTSSGSETTHQRRRSTSWTYTVALYRRLFFLCAASRFLDINHSPTSAELKAPEDDLYNCTGQTVEFVLLRDLKHPPQKN